MSKSTNDVIYFSPAQRFNTQDYDDDPNLANGAAVSWGLPSNKIVDPIAQSIMHSILANGIDPTSVVLSGYGRGLAEKTVDDTKDGLYTSTDRQDVQAQIIQLARDLTELHETDRLSPSVQTEKVAEIKMLREQLKTATDVKPLSTYFFASHAAMFDNLLGDHNPILYAGGGEDATVAVYDRAALESISAKNKGNLSDSFKFSADRGLAYSVQATFEDLESAKLMECRVGYYEPTADTAAKG